MNEIMDHSLRSTSFIAAISVGVIALSSSLALAEGLLTHLRNLVYDVESFDYICKPFSSPMALVVNESSDFNTLGDFIAHAEENPGKLKGG